MSPFLTQTINRALTLVPKMIKKSNRVLPLIILVSCAFSVKISKPHFPSNLIHLKPLNALNQTASCVGIFLTARHILTTGRCAKKVKSDNFTAFYQPEDDPVPDFGASEIFIEGGKKYFREMDLNHSKCLFIVHMSFLLKE